MSWILECISACSLSDFKVMAFVFFFAHSPIFSLVLCTPSLFLIETKSKLSSGKKKRLYHSETEESSGVLISLVLQSVLCAVSPLSAFLIVPMCMFKNVDPVVYPCFSFGVITNLLYCSFVIVWSFLSQSWDLYDAVFHLNLEKITPFCKCQTSTAKNEH